MTTHTRHPHRHRPVRAAQLLASLTLLTACAGPGGGGEDTGLRIAVAPNAVLDAATAGLRTDRELTSEAGSVRFSALRNPDEIRTQLTSNSVDVLTLPSNIAANLHNRGVDVRILGVVGGPVDVLVGPDDAAPSWSSLRGATVHIPFKGDVNDVLFRHLARKNGLTPGEDLTVVNHPGLPDLLTAVSAGEVDYALLPEHQASLAVSRAASVGRPKKQILTLGEQWRKATGQRSLPTYAVGVRGRFAEDHPELVGHLHRALTRSARSAADRPAAIAPQVARRTGAPGPLVTGLLDRLTPTYRSARDARPELTALFTELAAASPALVGGKVPGAGLYVTEGP
ncbi:ABC transporter substrate-binding protein [Streptomyces sp. NPDC059578]|uniref:ABC transporter substrate-binding protein n=1 Tax=Streptomyces sp. NPDC059578 TaxID=3346874 RepID=UPI0036B4A5D4